MLASVHHTINILDASQAFHIRKYPPVIAWRQFSSKIARSPERSIELLQLHGFGKLNLLEVTLARPKLKCNARKGIRVLLA